MFKNSLPKGKRIQRFVRDETLLTHHAADPRYDDDGASRVCFDTVKIAASIYKDYDVEQAVCPPRVKMGGEASGRVYPRTDERKVCRQ